MVESQTTKNPIFEIQRLYVKEQSCKIPADTPGVFLDEWKPEIQMEMNVNHREVSTDLYEVVLRFHIAVKNTQRTACLIDIQQAGIFKIEKFTEEQKKLLLEGVCPNTLYSYARKVIADVTLQASFPPLTLAPINFEALYQQRLQQNRQTQESSAIIPSTQQEKVTIQ